MKRMNLVKVMNQIESENATMAMLLNPDAFWNKDASIDIQEAYEYYVTRTKMQNDDAWDMIEHCERYGWDYTKWLDDVKEPMPFLEWLMEWQSEADKYMVS